MTDNFSDASAHTDSSSVARIDRALGRIELRIRQMQASAASADQDRAALVKLQDDVQGSLHELDQLIAATGG